VGWRWADRATLADEALWLAEVVAGLLPDDPEALGLHALLLYAEARRPSGRDGDAFVPLHQQDPARWNDLSIARADRALRRAHARHTIGPFQLEAAIQSALTHGLRQGEVDRQGIVTLYDGLVKLAPTLGVRVGRAAAVAEHAGPEAGLAALDAIDGAHTFLPWWAVRAALLRQAGDPEAAAAYATAAELADDPAVRAFLAARG